LYLERKIGIEAHRAYEARARTTQTEAISDPGDGEKRMREMKIYFLLGELAVRSNGIDQSTWFPPNFPPFAAAARATGLNFPHSREPLFSLTGPR
jgi:hypothetical protein